MLPEMFLQVNTEYCYQHKERYENEVKYQIKSKLKIIIDRNKLNSMLHFVKTVSLVIFFFFFYKNQLLQKMN